MGVLRFIRRLNCFGSGQRKHKSRRKVEKELNSMQETIRMIEEDIHITRSAIEMYKQLQRTAEENQKMTRNTRSHLMFQVEQIEGRLGQALEDRQELMSGIIESGIRKMTLENSVQAMENKANFFWNDLYYPTANPEKCAKKWQESLRRVRSVSDLNKAMLQPPLCLSQEFDEINMMIMTPVWQANWGSSDDEVFTATLEHEVYHEGCAVTETFF